MPHLIAALLALLLAADPRSAGAQSGQEKFRLDGDRLVYDTEAAETGGKIEAGDVDRLRGLLRDNPQVDVLELNSGGGSVYAASEMARIVIDFDLDTDVSRECVSSCVTLFLAGAARRLQPGAKIGFHRRSWPAEATERYYESWREDERWDTPFDFASWIYEDTQAEIYRDLSYMVARGVSADFAIETMRVGRSDQWYPARDRLMRAGVLRDAPDG